MAEKLSAVPIERIRTPDAHVVGPALESLRLTAHDETLRELFANLLATSLDSDTAHNAHPSFVEVIRNMTPDEARIIQLFTTSVHYPVVDLREGKPDGSFWLQAKNYSRLGQLANCKNPDSAQTSLDNLRRLGLLEIVETQWLTGENAYEQLEQDKEVAAVKSEIEAKGRKFQCIRKLVQITNFGLTFLSACVIEKSKLN